MARLSHPNVVTLFELGDDEGQIFLVMELVPGGSVAERLASRGPIPPRMASGVLLGLLSALQVAHDSGVIHRDVKPHNILLDLDGTPKVTDFGIARLEDGAMTRTGALLGTMAYMAPEQKTSARKVDPRSDLYAAGCTLYAMLTAAEPHDLFVAGLDPDVGRDVLGRLPPPLAEIIQISTSFRAEERYPSASAMAEALQRALQALPDDPDAAPLVDPERASAARGQGTVGPTLLDTTSSDVATEIDVKAREAQLPPPVASPVPLEQLAGRTIVPLSPARPQPSSRRLALYVALLALVLALGSGSVYGLLLRWNRLQAEADPPREEPRSEQIEAKPDLTVDVAPIPEIPVEDPAPQIVQANIKPPKPRKVVPKPEVADVGPEDPPLPPVQPAPATVRTRWNIIPLPDRKVPGLVATLEADREVVDSDGARGRPTLVLRCERAKLEGILSTGVDHLELSPLDPSSPLVSVEIEIDGARQKKTLSTNPREPSLLEFRGERRFVSQLLGAQTLSFRYVSFLGAEVAATFHPKSPDLLLEIEQTCK